MGLVQDSLLGIYRFSKTTREDYYELNLMEKMRIIGWLNTYMGVIPKEGDGTGIITSYLPKINYEFTDDENKLKIINGVLKPGGYFTKGSFGPVAGGIIHTTYNDYGPEMTRHLFDNTNLVAMQWILIDGFSVGLGDLYIHGDVLEKIRKQVNNKLLEAKLKIDFLHKGMYPILGEQRQTLFNDQLKALLGVTELPNDPERFLDTGKSIPIQFEMDIYTVLDRARSIAEKSTYEGLRNISKEQKRSNRMMSMVESGSKGSKTNLVQIISLLGQQGIEGGRAPEEFHRRSLPHFCKDDVSPESKGFIDRSFLQGLTPLQYVPHSQAGRIGVISTAIKTADTGYIQRRLVKMMEDAHIAYDGTVRNANDLILQYSYGYDGFDGTKLESQKFDYLNVTHTDFQFSYSYLPHEMDNMTIFITPGMSEQMFTDGDWRDKLAEEFRLIDADRTKLREMWGTNRIPKQIYSPINFVRLIKNYQYRFHLNDRAQADINPLYIIDQVQKLVADVSNHFKILHGEDDYLVLIALMRSHLASKKLVKKFFTTEAFDFVIREVRKHYFDGLVNPGEMVGSIAAQSIGEPTTQLCHHRDEMVLVITSGLNVYTGTIGKFVDNLMQMNPDKVARVYNDCCSRNRGACTEVLDLENEYLVASLTNEEKLEWSRLTQVSRHHAHGNLMRVVTKSGRSTTATMSHSFIIRGKRTPIPIEGSKLKIGDRIPVARILEAWDKKNVTIGDKMVSLDREFGRCVGLYLIRRKHQAISIVDKLGLDFDILEEFIIRESDDLRRLPPFVYSANAEFISEVVDTCAKSKRVIEGMPILYAMVGKDIVDPELDKIPNLHNSLAFLEENDCISRKALETYMELTNYSTPALEQAVSSHVVWDEITDIQIVGDDGEYVYDFTVPSTESFMLLSGIIAHNTLDVFHSTGVSSGANVSRGVPRLKEILRVAKTLVTPSLEVHIDKDYLKGGLDLTSDVSKQTAYKRAEALASNIEYTVFSTIVENIQIIYDKSDCFTKVTNDQPFIQEYYNLTKQQSDTSPWILRIQFRKDIMFKKNLRMLDIQIAIMENIDNMTDAIDMDGNNIRVILNDENSPDELVCRISIKNNVTNHDPIKILRILERKLLNTKILGVMDITTAKVSLVDPYSIAQNDGTIENSFDYVIYTNGVNLLDIFNVEHVDYRTTISNHILEILDILGIEAAREMIIKEINDVLEYTGSGSKVNQRHISLLVDIMTRDGYLISVDRHGINKGDSGPLARASFEETTKQLFDAAKHGEVDPMQGVSANIMFGQPFKGGTNAFDLALDEVLLANTAIPEQDREEEMTYSEEPSAYKSNDYCNFDNFDDKFVFQL
jgi:DNA-directed RNA polymerase beta' subunit